ncbi:MAG: PAS domain S-box protein, partial [Nitrospinae bacterium]|nr:PAS domain S-box protein [Nitrospinota bacterium]
VAQGIFRDISGVREAEAKLRASEERFRVSFHHAPIGMALVSRERKFLQVNPAFCRMLGYEESELLSRTFTDITHPDDQHIGLEFLQEFWAGKRETVQIEKRYLHRDGRAVWVQINVSLGRGAAGEPLYTIAQIQDITGRKTAQDNDEKSRARLNEAQRMAHFGSWEWDMRSGALMWSDEMFRILGYEPGAVEASLDLFRRSIHTEERDMVEAALATAMGGTGRYQMDRRVARPDGGIRVIHTEGFVEPDEKGNPIRMVGFAHDVTERTAAEDKLRRSEERYRQLVDNSPDIIYSFSDKRGGVYYSASAGKILGYPLDYLYAHPFLWNQSIHPDDLPRVAAAVEEFSTGKSFDIEYRVKNSAGEWLWLRDRSIGRYVNGDETIVNGMATDLTRQKAQEEALRQSEEKFRALFNGGNDAVTVVLMDENGAPIRFVDVNERAVQLYGYSKEEFMTLSPVTVTTNPAYKAKLKDIFHEINTKGSAVFEWESEAKDGRALPLEISTHRLTLRGKPHLVSIIRDISGRKKAEAALKQSEERYRDLIESSADCICLFSRDGELVYMNPAGVRINEFDDSAQPLGRDCAAGIQGEGARMMKEAFERAGKGAASRLEYAAAGAKGAEVWWSSSVTPIWNERGEVTSIMRVSRDITLQKKAAAALRDSEERFSKMFEHAPVGITMVDMNRQYIAINPAFQRLIGYSLDEMRRMTFKDFTHPEDVDRDLALFGKVRGGELDSFTVEKRYITKSGSVIWANTSVALVRNAAGEPRCVVAVVEDISERRRRQELETLTMSLDMANRELREFAHVASHDLQEPLRAIIGFSERISHKCSEGMNEKALDYLARIQRAATRMSGLINDLLAYATAAATGGAFATVDLNALLAELLNELAVPMEEAGAEVTVEPLPPVHGDRSMLRQIFQNLLSNSLKYRKADIPLRVAVRAAAAGSCHWAISVEDNGIGFDPVHSEKIFKVFERLHSSSDYAGSGVGLAICRKIAERHGGGVAARGRPGEGAVFTVTLPCVEAPAA